MDTAIGVGLILSGTIWFLWSLNAIRKGHQSLHWNMTTGTITRSEITDLSIQKGHGTAPIIQYEFSVRGRTYKSDRVIWGLHLWGARSASAEVTERYQNGEKVKVYYNPDNVGESVLDPGIKNGAILSLIVSIVPVLAGIIQINTGFLLR